ncbi:MAG: hypothetical protein ACLUZZ_05105 [Alistipes inops]
MNDEQGAQSRLRPAGRAALVNSELEIYRGVEAGQIMETDRRLFRRDRISTLVIYGKHGE